MPPSANPQPVADLSPQGFIQGAPLACVRAENLAMLIVATIVYRLAGGGWTVFAILFFIPDLSMLGYLAGAVWGSRLYNLAHTYIVPVLFVVVLRWTGHSAWQHLPLIWCSHIGFDRTLGFGLKYPSAFGDTHLGRLGTRSRVG